MFAVVAVWRSCLDCCTTLCTFLNSYFTFALFLMSPVMTEAKPSSARWAWADSSLGWTVAFMACVSMNAGGSQSLLTWHMEALEQVICQHGSTQVAPESALVYVDLLFLRQVGWFPPTPYWCTTFSCWTFGTPRTRLRSAQSASPRAATAPRCHQISSVTTITAPCWQVLPSTPSEALP